MPHWTTLCRVNISLWLKISATKAQRILCVSPVLPFEGADYRIFLSNLLLTWCEVCRWRTLKIPFRVLSRYISGQFSNRSSFWWNYLDMFLLTAAAAAKSLQPCPTRCNPIDGSPPGSPVPGILQARTLEWVAISFSNAGKWKVRVNRSVVSDPQRPHGLQLTRLLHPWDFPGKSTGVGCHCLLLLLTKPQIKWTCFVIWKYVSMCVYMDI